MHESNSSESNMDKFVEDFNLRKEIEEQMDLVESASKEIKKEINIFYRYMHYKGNYVVIKFPISTEKAGKLLLYQPVVKGDSGIWAVEEWMNGDGDIYSGLIDCEGNIAIENYYRQLQRESNENSKPWLTNPIEVGYDFIINKLNLTSVKKEDMAVINPATYYDFYEEGETHYLGYITNVNLKDCLISLDTVEYVTIHDKEKIKRLNLYINNDFSNGFYIYNKENSTISLKVSGDTDYIIIKDDKSQYINKTREEFDEYNSNKDYNHLYHVYTINGIATRIVEYIP